MVILWKKGLLNLIFRFKGERFDGVNVDCKVHNYFFLDVYSPCKIEVKGRLLRSLLELRGRWGMGVGLWVDISIQLLVKKKEKV